MPHPDLTSFKALSFDCYGTLINWEPGLLADLSPLLSLLPASHPWRDPANPLLPVQRFYAHSAHLWAVQPTLAYDANLIESFRLLAAEAGVSAASALGEETVAGIGAGPGRWPAFADTVEGLKRLGRYYKLAILSNVNDANIARAVAGPLAGARFDAVYTAQQIGSYKPDLRNFAYLFEKAKAELGADKEKGELLHVARSLTADHVPAKQLQLRSVWIARGGDKKENYGVGGDYEALKQEGKLGFEWMFQTIGEFADEVERQFTEKEKREKEL
ncbi:hypothetical protein MFIFM68171_00201 [Madurella fahalii]|uniref:Haloacid dehalogenase n=1 Tax=Madurella fahalii TaxID=1157608 RepID=A0ABQ0FWY3_9PEZI